MSNLGLSGIKSLYTEQSYLKAGEEENKGKNTANESQDVENAFQVNFKPF